MTKTEGYFQAVGQISLGVVGVVVGYYFNHRRATEAESRQEGFSEQAKAAMAEAARVRVQNVALTQHLATLLTEVQEDEG